MASSKVWGGKIPVVFNLASREVTAMETPLPIYMLLPRMSYLPLVTKTVREHFAESAPAMRGDAWFDHDRVPLRWNLPIGVLFDLFPGASLPFQITIHFTGFPTASLLPCRTLNAVTDTYFHNLKEACFLKYGTSKIIMNMGKSDHEKIGEALVKGDMKLFGEAAAHTFAPGGAEATQSLERLPVRILFSRGFTPALQKRSIMPSIKPKTAAGGAQTLRSGLSESVPALDLASVDVRIQGITPPLDASLEWLCNNFCHADQFLYVIIRRKKRVAGGGDAKGDSSSG